MARSLLLLSACVAAAGAAGRPPTPHSRLLQARAAPPAVWPVLRAVQLDADGRPPAGPPARGDESPRWSHPDRAPVRDANATQALAAALAASGGVWRGQPPTRGLPRLEGDVPAVARARGGGRGLLVTQVNDTYTYPASAAVKILWEPQAGYLAMCSGSLVSPFHVLSAGHCVYDFVSSTSGSYYDVTTYYVIPGQTDAATPWASNGWSRLWSDKPFGIARVTATATFGYVTIGTFAYDYSVLTLDRPIGSLAGTNSFASNIAVGTAIVQRGYPGGDYAGVYQYYRSGYSVTGQPSIRESYTNLYICGGDSGSSVQDTSNVVRAVAVGIYYSAPPAPACSVTGTTASAKRLDASSYNNVVSATQGLTAPAWSAAVYEAANPATATVLGVSALKGTGAATYAQGAAGGVSLWFTLFNQGTVASGSLSLNVYYTSDLDGSPYANWLETWDAPEGLGGSAARVFARNTSSLPPLGTWWLVVYWTYAGQAYSEDAIARTLAITQVTVVAPSASPTGTRSLSATASAAAGTPSPTRTRTPAGTGSDTSTPAVTPSLSVSASGTAAATVTPSSSVAASSAPPTPSSSITSSVAPSGSGTVTASPPPTGSGTPMRSGSITGSASATASAPPSTSAQPTGSPTPTVSGSVSGTPSGSAPLTPTSSGTTSGSTSRSATGSVLPPASMTGSQTAAATQSPSVTGSASGTPTATRSPSGSMSGTAAATGTPTGSQTPAATGTPTGSQTAAATGTPTGSQTAAATGTPTPSLTAAPTTSPTGSTTAPATSTPSGSAIAAATGTPTGSVTGAATSTPPGSAAPSATGTPTGSPPGTGSPSASAMASAAATSTPPGTPAATASPTSTPSPSALGSPSDSPTASPSVTPTRSGTRPPSSSGSRSRSATPSRTKTRLPTTSTTRSATVTPSPTPLCPPPVGTVTRLTGANGTSPTVALAGTGNTALYTTATPVAACGNVTWSAGPRGVYRLDLGAGTPLGGLLTVTTCGATADDTVLAVGGGCPLSAAAFGCLAGSKNAGSVACPSNSLASTATLTARAQVVFVQVGGAGGRAVVSGLRWNYAPPATPSRTRSRTGSRSATRKPKLR